MWQKRTAYVDDIDVEQYDNGYLFVPFSSTSFDFSREKGNHFPRSLFTNGVYLWRVRSPLQVLSSSNSHLYIKPAGIPEGTLSQDYVGNKEIWDLSLFILTPFDYKQNDGGYEKLHNTSGGMQSTPSSLLFAGNNHRIHARLDNFFLCSHVMPSQLLNHFYDWLSRPHEVLSHHHTFDQRLEGKINLGYRQASEAAGNVIERLEQQYEEPLFFTRSRQDRQREAPPKVL
jgi:hypothetical protein